MADTLKFVVSIGGKLHQFDVIGPATIGGEPIADAGQIVVADGWADCPVAGCPNKICLRLSSPYCHPHTMEWRRRRATRMRSERVKRGSA